MVEENRLTPKDGGLAIDVKGDLAAMLAATSPKTEDWQRQLTLVTGACSRHGQRASTWSRHDPPDVANHTGGLAPGTAPAGKARQEQGPIVSVPPPKNRRALPYQVRRRRSCEPPVR